MTGPILLYSGLVRLTTSLARTPEVSYRQAFIRFAYSVLPIALFYHLAHNSEHLLMEGQKVLPLLSNPFGWEWNLFGQVVRPLNGFESPRGSGEGPPIRYRPIRGQTRLRQRRRRRGRGELSLRTVSNLRLRSSAQHQRYSGHRCSAGGTRSASQMSR